MLFFVLAVPQAVSSRKNQKYRTVFFKNGAKIKAEVANTPQARQMGLMFRKKLPEETGMLFVFSKEAPHQFWTKNCQFPLDIIWFNKKKEIIYIVENVPPCKNDSCPHYGPEGKKSLYVVETEAGFVQKRGLALGMKAIFD